MTDRAAMWSMFVFGFGAGVIYATACFLVLMR